MYMVEYVYAFKEGWHLNFVLYCSGRSLVCPKDRHALFTYPVLYPHLCCIV